nr:FAD-binding oxidoreductase [Phaeobacter sp. J2-8]
MNPYPNRGPAPLAVDNTSDPMPKSADFVVIGGGIMGVTTARDLVRQGHSVVLVEKGIIGGEQSSRNWGWIRQAGRDLRELPLAVQSRRLWRGLSAEFGPELGYVQCGIAYAANSAAQLQTYQNWAKAAHPYGVIAHILSPDAVATLIPALSHPVHGALHTPQDGRAEPQAAAPLIARAARDAGLHLFQGCAAFDIETDTKGICAVRTETGRIATRNVVVAGGFGRRRFWRGLGCVCHSSRSFHPRCAQIQLRPISAQTRPNRVRFRALGPAYRSGIWRCACAATVG